MWPRIVPDLYAGEPVVVSAAFEFSAAPGNIALSGRRGGAAWGTLLPQRRPRATSGVGVLWARAKIDALMDAGRRGAPEQEIRAAVLDVALTHHLVSKFTSLVAVDVTPTKAAGIPASKTAVPGNIPEGLTGFDQLPRTATPAPLLMLLGALAMVLAAALAFFRKRPSRAFASIAAIALAVAVAHDADAQSRKPKAPQNHLLLPGHYDGDVGSFDAIPKDAPETGWFVLVKDAAGVYVRRIPDCRDAGPNSCASSSAQRSTTARRCNPRSASCSTSTCRRPRCARARSPRCRVAPSRADAGERSHLLARRWERRRSR